MKVIGLGLRASASRAGLEALIPRLGLAGTDGCALALPAFRRDLPLSAELTAAGYRLIFLEVAQLAGCVTQSQSPRSLAAYGTGSVAEACALRALGPGARLLCPSLTAADGTLTAALATDERPLP